MGRWVGCCGTSRDTHHPHEVDQHSNRAPRTVQQPEEPRLLALLRVVTLTSLCSAQPPCSTPTLSTPCISSKIVKGLTFVV
ncbi:hypothetical protein Pmani_001109 [Petrolisthes manimaculis]|uniref:Uncharacterized protein n=1 Tax=Petrolisthes manimaculis TaxID=1843537 RepID=A0AAE1QL76_9EUCA|nr:hypothetical protein Pmani_001109 [Petrolisthes manimaculis]